MQDENIGGLIFSQQLREEMRARGMRQADLAAAVGVTQGAISGWLNGAVPKMDKVMKIAEAMNLNPRVLLDPDRYNKPMREFRAEMEQATTPKQRNEANQRYLAKLQKINAEDAMWEREAKDGGASLEVWRDRALTAESKLADLKKTLAGLVEKL